MYDIYAYDMAFENCSPTKERISLIVPYAVIHYVLSGSGYVNGKKVEAGYAFCVSKNSFVDYFPDKTNPWSYIYVRFKGDELEKAYSDCDFFDTVDIFKFTETEELYTVLSLFNSINCHENSDAQKIIANALFLLRKSGPKKITGIQEKNAYRLKKYIDENYYKKITIEQISKEFYLSNGYIRNLFFKFYGISPKNYIQQIRMKRAKELLRQTDMNISVIAHSVGYDDPLLFSKLFSKYFNISPSEYRNK